MRIAWVALAIAAAGCSNTWLDSRPRLTAAIERLRTAQAEAQKEAPPPVKPVPPALKGEVRLTLLGTLALAMRHNPDVQIAGYDPLLAEADLIHAEAVFDPSIFWSNNFNRTSRPIQSQLDTGSLRSSALAEDRWAARYGLKQRALSGGTFSLYQEMDYLESSSHLVVPNPQYTSRLSAELSQPLLKGFGDPDNRAAIRIATLSSAVTLQDFRQKVMEVATQTIAAYWQLAIDREVVRVARETAEMAREVLRREEVRRKQGLSNELSIARAASALATREAELVRTENRVRAGSDRLLYLVHAPDLRLESDATIIPADTPRFFLVDVDRSASMARALVRRPEIERLRRAIEANQIRVDAADRARLPKLDAVLRYTMNGLGRNLGGAMEMIDPGNHLSWTAGLEFELPIGNRTADSDHAKRRVEYEQTLLKAEQTADQVMEEVSLAVRAVLQGRDEVEATSKAVTAARQAVAGENVRYELGQVTNEELLRAQDTLASAERDHLQAVLNFNLALAELERTQGTLMEDHGIEVVWPQESGRRPLPVGVTMPGAKAAPGPPAPPK